MQKGNFIYMLIGLLILLVFGPVLSRLFPDITALIIQLTFVALMVIAVWSLSARPSIFLAGIGLAALNCLLVVIDIFLNLEIIFLLNILSILLFSVLSAALAARSILFSGVINMNKIVGSICIYLLLGLIWGLVYKLIAMADLNAFEGLGMPLDQMRGNLWEYIYFSFVTLTTLGYGDITPFSPLVRTLAYLEAISGQFYLAILVASLVAAYLANRASTKKTSHPRD